MARHAIEVAGRVDVFKAIFNGGDLAKVNLCPVPRSQQYDTLKIFSVVSLPAGLYPNVTIGAFDRTGRQIERRGLNRPDDVIESKIMSPQVYLRDVDRHFVSTR